MRRAGLAGLARENHPWRVGGFVSFLASKHSAAIDASLRTYGAGPPSQLGADSLGWAGELACLACLACLGNARWSSLHERLNGMVYRKVARRRVKSSAISRGNVDLLKLPGAIQRWQLALLQSAVCTWTIWAATGSGLIRGPKQYST